MASAKARFYANQAKKGKITSQQASNAMAGKGLGSQPTQRSTASQSNSSPSQGYVSYDSNGNGMSTNQAPTTANQLFNIPTNALQNAISPKTAVYENPQSNYTNQGGSTVKKSSSSKSSSSNKSSNRSVASSIQNGANKVLGIPTANASDGIDRPAPTSIVDDVKNGIKGAATGLINYRNQANDWARSHGIDTPFNKDWGVSELLGIKDSNIIGESQQLNPNYEATSNPYDILDRTSPNDVSQLNDIMSGNEVNFSQPYNPSPTGIDRTTTNTEQDNPNRRPSAQPNNTPWQPSPITQGNAFTDSFTPPVQPQAQPHQLDSQTKRQYLGSGILSSGQYGNGGALGDRNPDMPGGSFNSTGVDQGNGIWDDLKGLLGETAQASETPFQGNALTQAMQPAYNPKNWFGIDNTVQPDMPSYTNGGGNGLGGGQEQKQKDNAPTTYNLPRQQAQGIDQKSFMKQYFNEGDFKGQRKNAEKQIANLIKQLTQQYDTQQTEGTQALEGQKTQDMNKLNTMFSFNNADPNDAQRMQFNQRTQNDYAGQLTSLLSKLAQAKSSGIMDIQNKGLDMYNQIDQQRSTARSAAAKAWEDYQNQQWDRNYKMQALAKKGTSSAAPKYTAVPNQKGGLDYYYGNTPISKQQFELNRWGATTGDGQPQDVGGMTDEELQAIING